MLNLVESRSPAESDIATTGNRCDMLLMSWCTQDDELEDEDQLMRLEQLQIDVALCLENAKSLQEIVETDQVSIDKVEQRVQAARPNVDVVVRSLAQTAGATVLEGYGGSFAWTGPVYALKVHKGSLLQALNRFASKVLLCGSVVFVSDGTFRRECGSTWFTKGSIKILWRYDVGRSCIVIDFFHRGRLMNWRFDELRLEHHPSKNVPALHGVGHVGTHTFAYTMSAFLGKDAVTLGERVVSDQGEK
jgi:hypothetical protein